MYLDPITLIKEFDLNILKLITDIRIERQTYRQTDATELITTPHSLAIIIHTPQMHSYF